MTNREKLRQMTDEELAAFIDANGKDAPCRFICGFDCCNPDVDYTKPCPKILEWLREEATV